MGWVPGASPLGSSKTVFLKQNLNDNKFLCSFKNINTASHFLCCSTKTIQRASYLGFIYIPDVFIPYLNNEHIMKNNSLIEFIDKSNLDRYNYIGRKNKQIKLKATLTNKRYFTKFFIELKLRRLI